MTDNNTDPVNDIGLPYGSPPAPSPSSLFQAWQLCMLQWGEMDEELTPAHLRMMQILNLIEAEIFRRPPVTAVNLAELFAVQSINFSCVPLSFDKACRTLLGIVEGEVGT